MRDERLLKILSGTSKLADLVEKGDDCASFLEKLNKHHNTNYNLSTVTDCCKEKLGISYENFIRYLKRFKAVTGNPNTPRRNAEQLRKSNLRNSIGCKLGKINNSGCCYLRHNLEYEQ